MTQTPKSRINWECPLCKGEGGMWDDEEDRLMFEAGLVKKSDVNELIDAAIAVINWSRSGGQVPGNPWTVRDLARAVDKLEGTPGLRQKI